jgi:small subunit ribosomal protein S17
MKTFTGVVTGTGMQKTAVVEVSSMWTHPKYQKSIKRTKKYLVHDEDSKAKVGDTVIFAESRPISKRKYFTLVNILKDNK